MLRLRIRPAEGALFERTLEEPELVVGRSSSAGLLIRDRFLSRLHARFSRDGERVMLEDLGSRNGTLLNGHPVTEPAEVRPGDRIQLSQSVIEVLGEERDDEEGSRQVDIVGLGRTVFRQATTVAESSIGREPGEMEGEEALRRHAERLRILNDVHKALARSVALDELLSLILDRVFDHLRPEKGVIFLRDREGELYRAASRSENPEDPPGPYSRTLAQEVTEHGRAALVQDAREDERFAEAQSILASGVRSLLAAPLQDASGCLGMIVLDSRTHVRQFTEDDLDLLVILAAAATLRIRNVALAEEAAEHRLLEEELALARRIQEALLPERLPELPGYRLFAGNVPSRRVSGDYYSVLPRAGLETCVLMLADISGKGIAASLVASSLEALVAGPVDAGDPPEEIFNKVSRRLHRRTPTEKFATAFLVELTLADGGVRYASAGHNEGILVRRDGRLDLLPSTGPPLGLLPDIGYLSGEATLEPGDVLVLYTDGITEATDPDEEEFGLERLSELLVEHREEDPESLAGSIDRVLGEFVRGIPFADDRTMILLRREA